MKNTFLIALLLSSSSAFAQSTGPANIVKTNPFGYFAGQYQFGYERALTDNFSVQLQAGIFTGGGEIFLADSTGNLELYSANRTGIILIPEARFYPGGNACEGFYLAASGRYRSAGWNDGDDENIYTRKAIGGALTLGYQYSKDGMMVDLFVGPQYKNTEIEYGENYQFLQPEEETGIFSETSGTGVRLGVSLGFGF